MKLEALDFGYCDARKLSPLPAERLNTSLSVTDARAEKDILMLSFAYMVTYDPGKSVIRIDGVASFSDDEAQKIAAEWKRLGRIEGEKGEEAMNLIHYNSVLNLVFIARAMNMSPPLILPRMKLEPTPAQTPNAPSGSSNRGKK